MFHLLAKIAAVQILRANQNPLADFLHRLGYFIKRGRKRLDVFALERRDKSLAKLLGQLLRNLFVFAPAAHKCFQTLRRSFLFQLFQKVNQMVHASVCFLRARLQQIEELLVVPENFLDRQHKRECF